MTIFLILIVMICLYKIKFVFSKDLYNIRYMDFDRTTSMKGLFILFVFLSHANNYFNSSSEFTSNILNKPYSVFQSFLGQGIVVMFLVYSGYGVMESIKKRAIVILIPCLQEEFLKLGIILIWQYYYICF